MIRLKYFVHKLKIFNFKFHANHHKQKMSNFDKVEENDSDLDKNDKNHSEIDSACKDLIQKWTLEQQEWRGNLKLVDTEPWQQNRSVFNLANEENSGGFSIYQNKKLRYVAGLDISFVKNDVTACSGLFVFDLSDNMKLVYKDIDAELIKMDQPYVPGFLAYREAPILLKKLEKLKTEKPHLYPHCIFIDGNGVLHGNRFGMACHIGYLSDTPTIGVSKKMYQVFGLENNQEHKERIKNELKIAGDYFELRSVSDDEKSLLGFCYRSTAKASNPIYVSIGNKISWDTCLWILRLVIKNSRIPEPIRQADLQTREFLRTCDK